VSRDLDLQSHALYAVLAQVEPGVWAIASYRPFGVGEVEPDELAGMPRNCVNPCRLPQLEQFLGIPANSSRALAIDTGLVHVTRRFDAGVNLAIYAPDGSSMAIRPCPTEPPS
jgi:hypothetical protein